MKTIQYHGPFAVDEVKIITLDNVYKILQIGIERPLSVPITVYQNDYNIVNNLTEGISATIEIDGIPYKINENDILEFNGLSQSSIKLKFLSPVDKYTIIDLAFKDVDE